MRSSRHTHTLHPFCHHSTLLSLKHSNIGHIAPVGESSGGGVDIHLLLSPDYTTQTGRSESYLTDMCVFSALHIYMSMYVWINLCMYVRMHFHSRDVKSCAHDSLRETCYWTRMRSVVDKNIHACLQIYNQTKSMQRHKHYASYFYSYMYFASSKYKSAYAQKGDRDMYASAL